MKEKIEERSNPAKRIHETREGNRIWLALHGRDLSPIEHLASVCMENDNQWLYENAAMRFSLEQIVVRALRSRDTTELKQLVKFIEEYQPGKKDDPDRFKIILLKDRCEKRGEGMTFAHVRKAIDWRGADRTLRRMLEDLQFPLIKLPGGAPRNNCDK